jgi:hypothetical protein
VKVTCLMCLLRSPEELEFPDRDIHRHAPSGALNPGHELLASFRTEFFEQLVARRQIFVATLDRHVNVHLMDGLRAGVLILQRILLLRHTLLAVEVALFLIRRRLHDQGQFF